jgi:hypothetical protein
MLFSFRSAAPNLVGFRNKAGQPHAVLRRAGFTMAEVLISSVVVVMIVMAIATLTSAVQQNADYSYATTTVHQHGRVILERIAAAVNGAAASTTEPPVAVISATSSTYTFPDTLVVWREDKDDAKKGSPQANELVVYCPNPGNPSELWELTDKTNTQDVTLADAAALATRVSAMQVSSATEKATLTTMMRSTLSGDVGVPRAGLRFTLEMRPDEVEWSGYLAARSDAAWKSLSWAQGIHGSKTGLRQARVAIEVQLVPEQNSGDATEALPFLGSAAVYYELKK